MKKNITLFISLLLFFNTSIFSTNVDSLYIDANSEYRFLIQPVEPSEYVNLLSKYYKEEHSYTTIEDFDEVRTMLKDIVYWGEDQMPVMIKPRQSHPIEIEDHILYFRAYYPQEDILYFEGEHGADVTFNLTTGESTEYVGIPEAVLTSPNNKFRLGGYWGGQECTTYFIQEYKNGRFRKIGDITQPGLCNTSEQFWFDDTTLYYQLSFYDGQPEVAIGEYYKLTIQKK